MVTETVTHWPNPPLTVGNFSSDEAIQAVNRVAQRIDALQQKVDRIIQLLEEIKG